MWDVQNCAQQCGHTTLNDNTFNLSFSYFSSSSKLGGLLSVIAFFYNHEECTRVMWTPPLRESFGYPLSLVQILCVSWTLNSDKPCLRKNVAIISVFTTLYLMSWQFAQFTLFTQGTIHILRKQTFTILTILAHLTGPAECSKY